MRTLFVTFLLTLSLNNVPALLHSAAAQTRRGTVPVQQMQFKDIHFADQALAKTVRRFHTTAQNMARANWDRQPYKTLPDRRAAGVACAHWCSFIEKDGVFPD